MVADGSVPLTAREPAAMLTAARERLAQGGPDAAEALLREGLRQAPDNLDIARELAQLLERRGSLNEAADVLKEAIGQPHAPGWMHGAVSGLLRQCGRFDEAGQVLVAAQAQFPGEHGLLIDRARLASERGDATGAEALWRAYCDARPNDPQGWCGLAALMSDRGEAAGAAALLAEAAERFPADPIVASQRAQTAEKARDWPLAERLWGEIAATSCAPWWSYVYRAAALHELGRAEQAEAVLEAAQQRYPDEPEPFVRHAEMAQHRHDWSAAERRWRDVQVRFPANAAPYWGLVEVLTRLGDAAGAEAMAGEGLVRFPDDVGLRTRLSMRAEWRGDWVEAEAHQRAIVALPAPPHWSFTSLANAIAQQGRAEEAEAVLRQGKARYPGSADIAIAYARMAERRQLWHEAAHRWQDVASAFPARTEGYLHGAAVARQSGDLDAAERLIAQALEHAPADPAVLRQAAEIAFAHGHFERAVERWNEVRLREPENVAAAHRLYEARQFAIAARILAAGEPSGMAALRQAAAKPLGQRVIANAISTEAILQPCWSEGLLDNIKAWVALRRSPMRVAGAMLLDAMSGDFAKARRRVADAIDEDPAGYPGNWDLFKWLLQGAVLTSQWDIATRLLRDRFQSNWCSNVSLASEDLEPWSVRWEIGTDRRSRFLFHSSLIDDFGWFGRWLDSLVLFHDYTTSIEAEPGAVLFSLKDCGTGPGLAPSDHRPDRFLIPDGDFLGSYSYADLRCRVPTPWEERQPVALWRGTAYRTLGRDMRAMPIAWPEVQRCKLCLMALESRAAGMIDAKLTKKGPFTAEEYGEMERLGIVGSYLPPVLADTYKYQIDVDGLTNAWSALFTRLLTGSPVLKVASPSGFRQWYYDDLLPWENYIPVAADLSDLVDKIAWLREHDEAAQRIGANGRTLAMRMTVDRELQRARPIIREAFRHAAQNAA